MKKFRKALALTLCAAALVSASVMGTMAYLTDSETVTNTFTVGKVGITLDEAKVDANGNAITGDDAGRVDNNAYHLLPGHAYTKDPIIHVDADSENSYIFIKVDNNGIEAIEETAEGYTRVSDQILANGWTWWKNDGNVHYFYQEYTKNQSDKDLEVFQQFKVGDSVTNEQLNGYYIAVADNNNGTAKAVIVTGYAVQKDGFATAKEAWDATFGNSN